MWQNISLRARIYILLSALILINMLGGGMMVWYAARMDRHLTRILENNIAPFEMAEALETALINQKGFVSYYFLDNDANWLKRLGEYRQAFKERLSDVLLLEQDKKQKDLINRIAAEYRQYIEGKDQVIQFYKVGQWETGKSLHKKIRNHFFKILDLCEYYKAYHKLKIKEARTNSQAEARRIQIMAVSAMVVALLVALIFIMVIMLQILGPIRNLATTADGKEDTNRSRDEVQALKQRVHGMIEDIDQTQSELQKSREHLLQAEKMALVGKLAAGMAHSIRNPLTSAKMRLFSLNRTLELSSTQGEDFDVISDEIKHIDTIVQNFLEFSRPPKLKIQKISPSEVVDMAIQLLKHRLDSYNVKIQTERRGSLPEVMGDPEQLKEVLVNLVVNACEAMQDGGMIVIAERETVIQAGGRAAIIRLTDNGPGIAAILQDKIFQPFFTTKEEGTGLGLSIAERIVNEHGGRLYLKSQEDTGTTFEIALPIKEAQGEQGFDHR